ncbi:geranylgeranylglyceryl/heptaprenylglyceryl phosphate synthase [Flavobacteriaceae bacterium]|nr:geranylgeranylglyceryl/heptaprenylglyceryl phosphate synthase [Flavobacteriaceae bacterium]
MNIYQDILLAKKTGKQLMAVLIDPEKIEIERLPALVKLIHLSIATHIFVGGSTDKNNCIENVVIELKKATSLPIIIFPGSANQVSNKADGILFLSLISGRNPEYLIEQQVQAAIQVKESNLEVLPTGYILVDGGKESAVERVSSSKPICQTNSELILKTALAGEFSGKKIIYLEAGSGAKTPVKSTIISLVKNNLSIPLIVGGGIQTLHQLTTAYTAGADLVVIGTAFEKDPAFFNIIKKEAIHENIS